MNTSNDQPSNGVSIDNQTTSNGVSNTSKIVLAIVAVVLIGLGYVGLNKLNQGAKERMAKAEQEIIKPNGITKEFNVRSFSWGWSPEIIEVNAGDTVKLMVTVDPNDPKGAVDHGIGIDAFKVMTYLKVGVPTEVTFVASKRGEFKIFCSVACGEGHFAMNGKLIVK